MKNSIVGIVGSGAMGSGIAQVAAAAGHNVLIFDASKEALDRAKKNTTTSIEKLIEKQKIDKGKAEDILLKMKFVGDLKELTNCDLLIEAIVEDLAIKKDLFSKLEAIVKDTCVLASNTSSLSIASISAACKNKGRVVGIHFFNPATIMPLVEIIPGIASDGNVVTECKKLIDGWGKITVLAIDTPGFIVNRVARPFYGEALRIYEEGIADFATIDWAMKELGGFKMGPFELMDFIGHDVNYRVTESVWEQFFYDPKYKPAITQKRLFEAGFYGKKSNRGYYDYSKELPQPNKDEKLGKQIVNRIVCMLINEAAEAVYLGVCSEKDVETAMMKGVNYPKGLLAWGNELGKEHVVKTLDDLNDLYKDGRYRASLGLRGN